MGRFLRATAGDAGALLILDDFQWAGADAFDLLAAVVSGTGSPPVRLIAAYRDSETAPASPLGSFIADLARASPIQVLPLEPLSVAEARLLHASGLLHQQRGDDASSHAKLSEALAIVERLGGERQAERFRSISQGVRSYVDGISG